MISVFLREQKRYTQKELCDLFCCSEEKAVSRIKSLKEYGILKAVKASEQQKDLSDLVDEDVEIVDVEIGGTKCFYVPTFVGVITVNGMVLKCYPKYLTRDSSPYKQLKKVLKVLERYNSKNQIVRMFNGLGENRSFNLLSVFLFLLNDYYENGVYANTREVIESNGTGEILWEKTINEAFAFISNNRPYYIELKTRKQVSDEYDYFKRLHECVLTAASKELSEAGLLDLFDITEVDLTEETIDNFGDPEYILEQIEKELNIQFNTRKQLVLKTIFTYISQKSSLLDIDCFSMFGTTSFDRVWEDVCKSILNDQLDLPIGMLKLPVMLKAGYDAGTKLIDLVEKPLWSITGLHAKDTLIPDVVSICITDDKSQFVISDAKYYTAKLEPGVPPKSQPGIESVTKQYMYQLAYQSFIRDHGFTEIINCFIMPTETDKVIDKGTVSMKILGGLGLADIKVRLLPADVAYDYYLSRSRLSIVELNL